MQKALVRKQSSQSPSPQSALVSAALKLPRAFYEQKTISVAKQLLGCHAAKGRTARTEVMFGQAGHAYVYFIYGFYNMLNLVTEKEGYPAAVLIRAVEPVDGVDLMKSRRGLDKLRGLASGPGKLCQAFAIDRSLNGADLFDDVLYVEDRGEPVPKFNATPRIGVDYAGKWKDKPYRFFIRGSEFVSK